MNSSSSVNDMQAKLANAEPEVVIEYEPEPDDYNYEAPNTEVDEEEIKQLMFTGRDMDSKKVIMVIGIIILAAIIGWAAGLAYGNSAIANNNEQRRSTLASQVKRSFDEKVKNFNEFADAFDKEILSKKEYDDTAFDKVVKNYQKYDFMLDMSSDISSEVILLNNAESGVNPIKNLSEYSANTMLLTQLLSIHRNETTIDREDIMKLLEKEDQANIEFAMQIQPDGVYYLNKNAPRDQFANGILGIYTLREVYTDDQEISTNYNDFKSVKAWSPQQRQARDYVPTKAEKNSLQGLDLPNRLMYLTTDNRGKDVTLFADEMLIVDRSVIYGDAANALQRYERRNEQIKKLIESTREYSKTISADLNKLITVESKAMKVAENNKSDKAAEK